MATDKEQPKFRVTFVLASQERLGFPVFAESAAQEVKRAALWPEAPYSVDIIEAVDDRRVLLWGLRRLYAHIVKRGEGTFYMEDDEGRRWAVTARSVFALFVEDPSAQPSRTKRPVGFSFEPTAGDVDTGSAK